MSTEGERDPRWRRDENEIVYRDDAKVTLMSAAVKTEDGRFDVTGSSRCSDCPKPARGSRMTSPGRPKDSRRRRTLSKRHAPATLVTN
jgi:hypothetical protein